MEHFGKKKQQQQKKQKKQEKSFVKIKTLCIETAMHVLF